MRQILKQGSIVALVVGVMLFGGMSVQTTPLLKNREMPVLEREAQPSEQYLVRVPQDYSMIQAAIDAAAEGATVLIGPGAYRENLQITKSIRLVGAGQEQVQLRALDENKPIIYVFSKTPIQVYFQGLTLGDPTFSLEQLLLMPPPGPNPFARTGLLVVGPIQTTLRQLTIGGQYTGIFAAAFFDLPEVPVLFRPQMILDEVRLVRNGGGLGLAGAEGLILRSKIEENVVGVLGGPLFLHRSVVRDNRFVGIKLQVSGFGPHHFMGELVENEIMQNGIGIYLDAKEMSWLWVGKNRLGQNQQYAIVIQDPTCPWSTGAPLPAPFGKSAPIQIFGSDNELEGNSKGDLCPADYPWPPGFRK